MTDIKNFVKRQLPIIDAVNDKSTWYALRMTPLGAYTVNDLENFIKTITDTYVFTHEISKRGREHYHCVLNTIFFEDDLREKIREYLKKHFGIPKRGDANKQYNLSECIDIELSITYILKDGGAMYCGTNIEPDKLLDFKKKSYKKYDSTEFTEKLNEIKVMVKDNPNTTIEQIMERIVRLKSMYRQPINMNYIYQLSLALYLHNRPDYSLDYVVKFLSRLE